MNSIPQITDYQKSTFTAPLASGKKVTHDVYERGEGPVVMIIQELPGIGQETLRLAKKFNDQGFKVVLPHLFGPLGKVSYAGNTIRVLCMYREFALLASHRSSPVVDWLRALCGELKKKNGGNGIGVIGMCLTGNFAISLMADDAVLAGVASQPSLPLFKGNQIHLSPQEIAMVKEKLTEQGPMYALRFEDDGLCPAKRFNQLRETFNDDGQERIKLKTLPGKGHSVLTIHFNDEEGHPTKETLEEIFAYFKQRL